MVPKSDKVSLSDEWVVVNFLIEPNVKKKYESIITLKGYKTMSEALRDHIREVVKRFEEDEKDG